MDSGVLLFMRGGSFLKDLRFRGTLRNTNFTNVRIVEEGFRKKDLGFGDLAGRFLQFAGGFFRLADGFFHLAGGFLHFAGRFFCFADGFLRLADGILRLAGGFFL